MKHLRIEGVRQFSRMVPRLRELGLLSCQRCDDPASQRRNLDGAMICIACENTASVFWNRNLARLKEDEVDILEVRWETIEVFREIRAIALKQAVRQAVTTTTRTEHVPAVGESPAHDVTHTTERVEWIADASMLRVAGDAQARIAKMAGVDFGDEGDDDDAAEKRSKVTIELPDGIEFGDLERPAN